MLTLKNVVNTTVTHWRKNYVVSDYLIDQVFLRFQLHPMRTQVESTFTCRLNPQSQAALANPLPPLILQGEGLTLLEVSLDNARLHKTDYTLTTNSLTLQPKQAQFTVQTVVQIAPLENSSLMGLYISGGNFFTQCEAQGFRKITWFLDRPDVMARYRVRLEADQTTYPVLLANGNLLAQGVLPKHQHYAEWEDPFPKPSYLFALVAGNLQCVERRITSMSGQSKLLQIWVEARDLDKTAHAMQALVDAIVWDEQRFGRELDLERFMLVAVSDFNMGAMENKGLNIFNTKYVLASTAIATDVDFANIESVVGHEYFHNWSGNRVTCRDWFQLSLKEGLTVFRDQEFSMDLASDYGADPTARAVKRIEDVRALRAAQFLEDAGPMAHPIRPESYQEISNFYTATVYEKGAEVIRMLQTLLGVAGFRRGMDLYFARHDGQAVTCDDFVQAMQDANPQAVLDFVQFKHWYAQAGTPRVRVELVKSSAAGAIELRCQQDCPAVGVELQQDLQKQPYLIPLKIAFFDENGHALEVAQTASNRSAVQPLAHEHLICLNQSEQSFKFNGIPRAVQRVIPSLARDFSAPIVIEYAYTTLELARLMAHDTDPFNRWEAGQRLFQTEVLALLADPQRAVDPVVLQACQATLNDASLAPALREVTLTLPSETVLAEQCVVIAPAALQAARDKLKRAIAAHCADDWPRWIQNLETQIAPLVPYAPNARQAGARALRNLCLQYWACVLPDAALGYAEQLYARATNMTDSLAALTVLSHFSITPPQALADFAQRWQAEPLVMDKWFTVQALQPQRVCAQSHVLQQVQNLLQHPAYAPRNPNKIYALLLRFFAGNPAAFHRLDETGKAAGYRFWAEQVLAIDAFNPQVAARLARTLERWQRYTPDLAQAMQQVLQEVLIQPGVSKDVHEVVGKALALG